MRLTTPEQVAIAECARGVFGETCVVRLFGSRTDDNRRGGDIDLHIIADDGVATLKHEIAFRLAVGDRVEEQRVDVVLQARSRAPRPIDAIAVRTGVLLKWAGWQV